MFAWQLGLWHGLFDGFSFGETGFCTFRPYTESYSFTLHKNKYKGRGAKSKMKSYGEYMGRPRFIYEAPLEKHWVSGEK